VKRSTIVALVLVVAYSSIEAAATRAPALPFIENDFDKALAGAKSAGKPLFVEVWAPW